MSVSRWQRGPASDRVLEKPHLRPVYAVAIHEPSGLIVTGSADHAVYVHQGKTGKYIRQLYTKTLGHTEWVTAVDVLPDERIVSGGMDSNVIIWAKSGTRCDTLREHKASISKIKADDRGVFISASYDQSLLVWDATRSGKPTIGARLDGHRAPVTTFVWRQSLVVSGARDGQVRCWDVNSGTCVSSFAPHKKQVMSSQLWSSSSDTKSEHQTHLLLTCGQDGTVSAWDLRSGKPAFLSTIPGGSANDLAVSDAAGGCIAVGTGSGQLLTLDPRKGGTVRSILSGHKGPVTAVRVPAADPRVCLSSATNGWVLAHDLTGSAAASSVGAAAAATTTASPATPQTQQPLYGFGAARSGPTNVLEVVPAGTSRSSSSSSSSSGASSWAVAANDDGSVCVLDFSV